MSCPRWFTSEARRAWKWVTVELRRMGLLTTADRQAITAYCQTWARWRKAEEFLDTNGETYTLKDSDGGVRSIQQVPQVSIARCELLILKAYQQELGLTPSARTRIVTSTGHRVENAEEDLANKLIG